MACYGGHKDATIHELLDPLPDLAAADLDQGRARLAQLRPLAYLVRQHTDGRGTATTPLAWWRQLADLDPCAAARLAADVLLAEPGLEDARADAVHRRLLHTQAAEADPVILAALRIAAGRAGRDLDGDIALLERLAALLPDDPACAAGILPVVANAITATYDDQPLMHASEAEGPEPSAALRDAAQRLGGDGVPPRLPRPDSDRPSPTRDREPRDLLAVLDALPRPALPAGAPGAIAAVRDYATKPYGRDPAAPRWSADALINAVGWRLIEVAGDDGADAALQLLHRLAEEFRQFGDTSLLADIASGLDIRRDAVPDVLDRVSSAAYTLAFTKISGGGGWLTFAGRDRLDLWRRATELDATTAAATLAGQVAAVVEGRQYGTVGVTQGLVAAFATVSPKSTSAAGAEALACWDDAFGVIAHRLPGTAHLGAGVYEPTTGPASRGDIDFALTRLALAILAMPERADRRRALVATTVLLAARPAEAQAAASRVLAADLGAGPLTWFLSILRDGVRGRELTDDLAARLTALARSDLLSVRVTAADILGITGHPVPDPPGTAAHAALSSAVADALTEDAL
jgi:hypothetical protein